MRTMGKKIAVTTVMTFRVYADDEALVMVRLLAALVLETITCG